MLKITISILFSAVIIFSLVRPVIATDGTSWKSWNENTRTFYVMGVVDAWGDIVDLAKQSNEMSVSEVMHEAIMSCILSRGMKYAQIVAIVDKYISDKPKKWNWSMPSLVWKAMDDACKYKQ
jgi:Ssp1 endopeptidase immunity protein Rap1a